MEQITFNDVPRVLQLIYQEIKDLRQELNEVRGKSILPKTLSTKQAAEFLGKSQEAIRSLVHRGKIKPCRNEGRLYFDREYLESWLRGGLPKEEEIDVTDHVIFKRRK
ncbi:helix-turn-helix domain-containing protein [Parapedobacter soli]|uniref:helix-turn-helix domain-containing protein n=1 Tax=Parapedobacter soli TaxID=416955 RepID=UPI0021C70C4D|nr:helix-turn-helix domain-containing protein [Parapedobacter soli]